MGNRRFNGTEPFLRTSLRSGQKVITRSNFFFYYSRVQTFYLALANREYGATTLGITLPLGINYPGYGICWPRVTKLSQLR